MSVRAAAVGHRRMLELSEEDKRAAEKAAKLIARDYGDVLRKLSAVDEACYIGNRKEEDGNELKFEEKTSQNAK